jgi:hypothetical protein
LYKDYSSTGIYDTSSATQLENTALKSVLTNETSYNSINSDLVSKNMRMNLIQKAIKKVNNEARKKWFDILSADGDNESSMESLLEKQQELEQQLSFKSLEESTNSTLSQCLIKQSNDDSLLSSNSSTADNSISKMRANRKIAKNNNNEGNRLDVAAAQINLQHQLNVNSNNSQRRSLVELKLHVSNDGRQLDRTLKQHSPPVAIQKEVIKCKASLSCDSVDLNIHQMNEVNYKKNISLNSSDASQKSLNERHLVHDLFVSIFVRKLLFSFIF